MNLKRTETRHDMSHSASISCLLADNAVSSTHTLKFSKRHEVHIFAEVTLRNT